MKLIQQTIESIVDTNFKEGRARNLERLQGTAAEKHAHELRARHVTATARKLGQWVRARIEHYRQQADHRRGFRQLLQLDQRLLKDIGLTRGDLISVRLGAISLEELDAVRESRRRVLSLDPVSGLDDGLPIGWRETADEAVAVAPKCA